MSDFPRCPVCEAEARLTTRSEIGQEPADEHLYLCPNYPKCDYYIGCHKGTDKPLGTMAGESLRALRRKSHEFLDWHWQKGKMTRGEAYRTLSEHLGLTRDEAHIGMFDSEQCRKTILFFRMLRPYRTPLGR